MDPEHQDGIVEKYILAKGTPESLQISIKRLAKFMAKLGGKKEYDMSLWNRARFILRGYYASGYAVVGEFKYRVRRVEAWPDYILAFEIEGVENGEG